MYTWGYIKGLILDKMELVENEASVQKLLNKYIGYANECLTYICSTCRPKQATYTCEVVPQFVYERKMDKIRENIYTDWIAQNIELSLYADEEGNIPKSITIDELNDTDKEKFDNWIIEQEEQIEAQISDKLKDTFIIGDTCVMPKDFVAFTGKSTYIPKPIMIVGPVPVRPQELFDTMWTKIGENKFVIYEAGTFNIAYSARWMVLTESIKDADILDMPFDVLDCIPAYVASQAWKTDDTQRAQIYTNEFEKAFARINNSDMRDNTTITSDGNW